MNNNGKIKGKFNIIDIFVILLMIVAATGFVIRFGSGKTTAVTSDVHYKYVVRVEKATMQSTLSNGEIKTTVLPDRFDCYVTIEANGRESEDGYILKDTTELSVGRTVEIITKYVHTSGMIESVEIIK